MKRTNVEEKPLTWREIRFVKMIAHGEKPMQAYLDCFETNNEKTAKIKSSVLLKQTRIKQEVEKEIEELLSDIGIDKRWTLEQAKNIVENDETSDAVKLRALENFMKIQSMYPKEKKSESLLLGQAFTGFSKEEILEMSTMKLIKDGKPFKMSKRKGDYITVEDLIAEVGRDATRFIMLNRSSDVELDFDFTKVKEKSKDNPLYYVQYCYARISSVFRHVDLNIENDLNINDYEFEYTGDEIKILKKIAEWPKCIEAASLRLEPHRIPVYLYELSSEFHSYWNMGKDDSSKRFINEQKKISNDKLVFLKVISNVIKSGMDIVGVDTPQKM